MHRNQKIDFETFVKQILQINKQYLNNANLSRNGNNTHILWESCAYEMHN